MGLEQNLGIGTTPSTTATILTDLGTMIGRYIVPLASGFIDSRSEGSSICGPLLPASSLVSAAFSWFPYETRRSIEKNILLGAAGGFIGIATYGVGYYCGKTLSGTSR
jgi:hypothetical protein